MPIGRVLAHLLQDLSYGLRMLRKNPGFTAVTAVTLALGIGANTAMFSVVDSLLLRPLPYPDSKRLMLVWEKPPKGDRNSASAANFLDWREQNRSFRNLVALSFASFNLSGKDEPGRVDGLRTSWDYFDALHAPPAMGRAFTADDDRPGAPRVAVISYALWQGRFGGDPQIVGRQVTIDGEPCAIVGVTPRSFRFFMAPQIWMPIALDRATVTRDFHYIIPMGSLKAGVSLATARAEMSGIAKHIEQAYPKSNKGWGAFVEPLHDAAVQDDRRAVLVLFGAVGFVLLIACVNVANLLLAKAAVRQRELAIRASLGAGRGRLVTQLLAESTLLAAGGGALGLALAVWLVKVLHALVPAEMLAGFAEIAIDWRVLAFAFALSLATGVLFGFAPAWRVTRFDLNGILKEAGRGSGAASTHARFRSVLVVAEAALSLVLLVCAGLMIRSLAAMQHVDPGFQPDHLLTMRLSMPEGRYPGAARVRAFYRQALDRVGAIPGVRSASLSMSLPLQGSHFGMPFQIASHPAVPISEAPGAPFEMVSPDYFRTMGITVRKGRAFTARDSEGATPVAVVNETFVKQYLPKEEPLGQRLLVEELVTGQRQLGAPIPWEIVGVVKDVKFGGLNSSGVPVIYVPLLQSPWPGAALAVRTATEPGGFTQATRGALAALDRDMPVTAVKTMAEIVRDSMKQSRLQTSLIGGFAAVALALAALGIYGIISYSVAQGTHDMGLRIALGATSAAVVRLVLRRATLLLAAGLAIGAGGALALTRLLGSMLYEVKATDPWTFAAVSLLLAGVGVAAAFVPAWRATRIDPLIALRAE